MKVAPEDVYTAIVHLRAVLDSEWAAWRTRVDERAVQHPNKTKTWVENTTPGQPRGRDIRVEDVCKHLGVKRAQINPVLSALQAEQKIKVRKWGVGYKDSIDIVTDAEREARAIMKHRRGEVRTLLAVTAAALDASRALFTSGARVDAEEGTITTTDDGGYFRIEMKPEMGDHNKPTPGLTDVCIHVTVRDEDVADIARYVAERRKAAP